MICRLCPAVTRGQQTHCQACIPKLLLAGLCKRCGERPRVPRRQTPLKVVFRGDSTVAPQPDYCGECLAVLRQTREACSEGARKAMAREAEIEEAVARKRKRG